MRKAIAITLALFLSVSTPAYSTSSVVEPVVPAQFLPWDQFAALPQQDRNLYLIYLNFVSLVLQDAKYPGEQLFLGPDFQTAFRFEDVWREFTTLNHAHAWLGVIIRVAGGVCLKGRNICARTLQGLKDAVSKYFAKSKVKTGEIFPPGSPIPASNMRTVSPTPNLPAVRSGSQVGQYAPRATGPTRLKATDVPPPAAPANGFTKGVLAGSLGTVVAEKGIECALGSEGICTKTPPPPAVPTSGDTRPPEPPPPEQVPKFERVKGATCIFGGYANQYQAEGDGGCKPPKGTINSKHCKGVKKPNFFCNDLGVTGANKKAAKMMCVPITSGQSVSELTATCSAAFTKLLDGKDALALDKDKYEGLVEKIKKLLSEKAPGQLSVQEYCGRDYKNIANAERQAKECIALKEMLDAIEKKVGKHPSAAMTPPAAAPKEPAEATK